MSIRVLDLFCGGGGSSLGARAAGAEIVCGIDAWPLAVEVYTDNFGCGVHGRITEDSSPRAQAGLGPIDLLLASPECTHHTCARGNRPRDEASKMTAKHVLNYARFFRPRWLVIENVVHMRRWSRFEELLAAIGELGYHVRCQVLDSADFGVPQSRRRLFILCDREEMPNAVGPRISSSQAHARNILDPSGTWATRPLFAPGRAAATLERAERGMRALPGQDFLVVYYGSDAAGGWQSLDRPLRTLTTLDRFGLVEMTDQGPTLRMLQVPELMRAMGSGEGYLLNRGTRRDKVKLLGNGVCPPVMEAIVRSLVEPTAMDAADDHSRWPYPSASCEIQSSTDHLAG